MKIIIMIIGIVKVIRHRALAQTAFLNLLALLLTIYSLLSYYFYSLLSIKGPETDGPPAPRDGAPPPGPAPGPPKTSPEPFQNLLQPLQTSLEAPQTLLEPSNSVQETPGRPPDHDFPGFWKSTWGHVGTQHEQNAVSVLKTPICI